MGRTKCPDVTAAAAARSTRPACRVASTSDSAASVGSYAGLGSVPGCPVEKLGDQVLLLCGQALQLVGVEPRLRLPQLPTECEQLVHQRPLVAAEHVDQPGAQRRPA